MFTVSQIENAHSKVKSGADFPRYIQEIKGLGVLGFTTWVKDSHTDYLGANDFKTSSESIYEELEISKTLNLEKFSQQLKAHQRGETDYYTFCKDCAENGVEKWVVCLEKMTCTYYDTFGNEVLIEEIPH